MIRAARFPAHRGSSLRRIRAFLVLGAFGLVLVWMKTVSEDTDDSAPPPQAAVPVKFLNIEEPILRSDGSWSPGFCREVEAGCPGLSDAAAPAVTFGLPESWQSDLAPLAESDLRPSEFGRVADHRKTWAEQSVSKWIALRQQWQLHLRTIAMPYAQASSLFRFIKGSRGIVTTIEGRTLAHSLTGLLILRSFGCTLDIEAWYYRDELNSTQIEGIQNFLSSHIGGKLLAREVEKEAERLAATGFRGRFFLPRHTGGDKRNYQLKIEAIMASSFEEVLFLDSDNLPTLDPTFLFSEPSFRSSSALFFQNIRRPAPDNPIWSITNLPWRFSWELETGQLVVSKPRAWCGLSLSLFFLHSEEYQPQYLFGDHDALYYGLLATNIPFSIVEWPMALGGAPASTKEFCATTMVQWYPRNRSMPLFYHANAMKYDALDGKSDQGGEAFVGSGPFPHVMRYSDRTNPVTMRIWGRYDENGRWCNGLGGEGEPDVEMEWSETDPAFTRRWQEMRKRAEELVRSGISLPG